ncbi:tRNA-dihydrouridine synthase family protein [Candidatus Woesearchaeota archaeon]|nr:tRNA-dihydrouridine synthase family protein [Candidatus Woesearchaeota archaeon]
MRIGEVKISSPLVLAPMANVTDPAFRLLCRKHGCGLTYTEMINANALVRANKATIRKAQFSKKDKPLVGQLFGAKIELLEKATKILSDYAEIIDINLGCPDKDVMKIGAGSSLLIKPVKIEKIIKAMKKATDKPITAKIRLGLDKNHINAVRNSKIIEGAGADAIAVHARTTAQGYSGIADWEQIRLIRDEISIPLIGNGDVSSYNEAQTKLKDYKVDSVMIGRAAMGNPSVFSGEEINKEKQIKLYEEYLGLAEGFEIVFEQKKRQALWFMNGFEGAVSLRREISKTKKLEEINKILENV